MRESCVYIPSRGKTLFRDLRKQYDYKTARGIFLRAISPKFIESYKDTLTLDSEGIPTFDSLLNNPFMKKFIGANNIKSALQKKFHHREDTRDNYKSLLSSAYQFNTSDLQSNGYVAIVEPTSDGKIGITIKPRSEQTLKEFQDQYATSQLNERLSEIFSPLGVNVGNLTQVETRAGRIGKTDFSVARSVGTSFASIVSVANNHEGERAISEEFAHLIVGIFRNEPLVQRAINTLQDHPEYLKQALGKDFEDTSKFYDNNSAMIAEEVLGQILQRNLLKAQEEMKTPVPSLFQRLYKWVVSKFKGYKESDVHNAIDSVDSAMSTLAKSILDGTRKITQKDIKQAQREAQFNALSDRIDRNIEILKNSAKVEVKKYKIAGDASAKGLAESRVNEILQFTERDADTVLGIFNYAKEALSTLRGLEAQFPLINTMEPGQKFGFLRNVRMYVQSYGSFLREMQDALNEERDESDNLFLRDFALEDGTVVSVEDVIADLNQLSDSLNSRFFKVAGSAFAEFLKPFIGESIVVPFGRRAGEVITIEELLKEAPSDISFMDRWLQSMADSSDVLLQGFDAAVKAANDATRLEVIDRFNKIHAWREKIEKLGITDFEWAFEKDSDGNKSGNYISSVNHAQFQKELKDLLDSLDEKYGVNPTGTDAIAKIDEKNAWLNTHSISIWGDPQPDPTVYRNEAYYNLSATQREVLDEFLAMKTELDKMHPENRVSTLKAIQARKSGSERFWESVTSPSTLFENIKESVAATFLDREDDDQVFGETTKRGLTDFAGNEFMVLPVLYTTRLRNPNEISTDLIGSLMAYTYSAVQYKNLDKIVDALEVGRALVSDPILGRKVATTRGNNRVREKFEASNISVVNDVFSNKSNIEAKLQDFMESKVYQRYMKDEGTWHIPILDKDVNKGKLANALLKGSSLAQLGFNWLANIANVATGMGMQNIEAAAGQFFTIKELAKADAAYFKEIALVAAEANKRNKTNKVSLFFDLFNIKQNFEGKSKRMQTKNGLKRLFGEKIAFLGQELGDHWMYGRTGIAIAMREQVLLNNQQMSLWDALQVVDYEGSETIKELNYKDITDLEGNPFNVGEFSRRVAHVNQVCFGIYNDEDANAANRVAAGRLLQQYRKWMTIQYSRRFRSGHKNLATDTWEEGYYITMGRYLNELRKGGFQFVAQYKSMTSEEQANIRRALFEMFQFAAVWALANWFEWPDDKNRPWALKLAEYSSKRLAHELGGLAPSTVMPQELLKTVKSPIPSVTVVQNGFNLFNSAIDPSDWTNEISSGPYKGMSNLEKNFIKAPIPGVAQYRQIDKFIGDLDSSISYYMRPY